MKTLAQAPRTTAFAKQRIYFVMTDRYANGDEANDRGGATGSRTQTGYDPADTGFFHGGDFKGLTGTCDDPQTGLARVKRLGFTALWVTPPVGQRTVQGGSAAYHGYWGTDFTSVDPHLGSDADFAAFVDCAHRLGLEVYLDVVVNHTADVITPSGGGYVGPEDVPYRDCRGKVFDPGVFAGGNAFPCLKAETMPRPPIVLPGDRKAKKPAWLNDPLRYHNRGDIDFAGCNTTCLEQGDFFGLDDLFTEQPAVVAGLAEVHGSWIRRFKVDGFRVDTAKHVDRAFFRAWVPKIRRIAREAGIPDFEIFGEAFVTDAIELSSYTRDRAIPNLLDFPLQDAVVRYAGGTAGAKGLAARLDDDDYFLTPSGVMPTPGTFAGNHDIGRVARLVKDQSGASGDELVKRIDLAHSVLYLLRGAPIVMYGDEVGIIGAGGDKEARQDLFPTEVRSWRTEERAGSPPIGTGSSFKVDDNPVGAHLAALAAVREANPALTTGPAVVRVATQGTFVLSRFDPTTGREVLVGLNASRERVAVNVQTDSPGAAWEGQLEAPSLAGGGRIVRLTLPALSASVWRQAGEPARRTLGSVALRVGTDELTALRTATATVTGGRPASVTFAIKRPGSRAWVRLATDPSPPYRAFVAPRSIPRGKTASVVAIVRAFDGTTIVSSVASLARG
ncbi:MAG: alpha-amylase family glycosyl hydrolase [Gaiellales bacterium]